MPPGARNLFREPAGIHGQDVLQRAGFVYPKTLDKIHADLVEQHTSSEVAAIVGVPEGTEIGRASCRERV